MQMVFLSEVVSPHGEQVFEVGQMHIERQIFNNMNSKIYKIDVPLAKRYMCVTMHMIGLFRSIFGRRHGRD